MRTYQRTFHDDGYLALENILAIDELNALKQQLVNIDVTGAGSRELLSERWCQTLANQLKNHPVLSTILPNESKAIQCTYFQKSSEKNWLVPLHQDLSIPVKEQFTKEGFTGWSKKQGALFVQPPSTITNQIIAVRLHIDDCLQAHGPLKVVPTSHQLGRIPERQWVAIRDEKGEKECTVNAGGVVIMSPLILHSSSKASHANGRRVLHFLFVPESLTKEIPFLFSV